MIDVLMWFLVWRWVVILHMMDGTFYSNNLRHRILMALHNDNAYGCRKHPVIYKDMCRIVRGGK